MSLKFVFTMRVVELLLYVCRRLVYMSMLGVLCMYVEFAFGWCAGRCEGIGTILVIGGNSMVCVSHCVVLVFRIFVVVGYLYQL